ncbi:MAG TPA: efflux RND transporter periplasmic adaptor subunit [Armatimonadota bacterium]|nr:efflux RND transporter periplasmic adaptor subunit [Armatimonadota bacterium]
MKRLALITAILAVLVVGFLTLGGSRSAEGPSQGGAVISAPGAPATGTPVAHTVEAIPVTAAPVSAGDMRQILEVTGSLKTDEDVQIGSRVSGTVVQVTVKEGDHVSRGQVLVRLDDREIQAEIARARGVLAAARAKRSLARNESTFKDASAQSGYGHAQAGVRVAKARVQQAESNLKLVEDETAIRIQNAQSGVRVATERLSIARETTRKQELRQAQVGVEQVQAQLGQAKVDLENARQMFERRENLFKQDAIAREEVEEAERRLRSSQANVRVAEGSLAVAQQKLELAREGARVEEVRVAEEGLSTAQLALAQAQSEQQARRRVAQDEVSAAKSTLEQAESSVTAGRAGLVQSKMSIDEVRAASAAIAQAEADIRVYETQRADLVIRAPVAGVVATRQVNEGETVTASTPLMNLVALDAVYLEASVPELEVGQLRPGAPAQVTVDALPGKKLTGAVREVIPVADRASRAFRVRIAVSGGRGRLPSGGYARAQVHVGSRRGVVTVPKSAILTEAGDKYVWVIADNGHGGSVTRRQAITVGLVNDQQAEIVQGLQHGQQVVAAGSPSIVEGALVSVGDK